MPVVMERQVNGPTEIDVPYGSRGVFTPAFERQPGPAHSLSELSAPRVADCGGFTVRHMACVTALGPS